MLFRTSLLLCLCLASAWAKPDMTIAYEASYIGVPLLNMNLSWVEDDSSIFVTYENKLKPFIAFFHPIHNIYKVHFRRDSFDPLAWSKTVSEGDLNFQLGAYRSLDGHSAKFTTGKIFPFPDNGFTVFSATHYLASQARNTGFFPVTLPVFIDGELWEAKAQRFDKNSPHPDHNLRPDDILISAKLHYLSGKAMVENNDILTSVIATEGTEFLLWVTPDGTYRKAQFGKFPKAVILDRIK